MKISYNDKICLAFDKPLKYKNVYIYPATVPYYSIFQSADECLDIDRLDEKDINLLRLPYLEYVYEKSKKDVNFKYKWEMLCKILEIVFKEQPYDIKKENGNLIIKVYQKTENFDLLDKEYESQKNEIIKIYNEVKDLNNKKIIDSLDNLDKLKDKMYKINILTNEDFDYIRQLIMEQNDIKSCHYSGKVKEMLDEAEKDFNNVNGASNQLDLEDLVTAISYLSHYSIDELYNMSIRRFNRIKQIALSKDDYYLYKNLELNGSIKMKSDYPYWLKHFEPKGKYDNVLIRHSSLLSSIGDDGKI